MIVLNFSHPLTPAQITQIERLTNRKIARVIEQMPQFDHAQSFAEQARALVDAVGLSSQEWQTLPILVNPPGYAPAALVLLAELHGRMGYFAAVVRIRPVANSTPTQYEVAEILNLQSVREAARERR